MRPGATTQATGEELVLCATTGIAIVVIPEAELHRRTVFHDHPHIAVIGGVRFEQIIVRGCAAGEWMNPALKRKIGKDISERITELVDHCTAPPPQ